MSEPKDLSNETAGELQDLQPEVQDLTAQEAEDVQGGILIGLSQPSISSTVLGNTQAMGDGSVRPAGFQGGVFSPK